MDEDDTLSVFISRVREVLENEDRYDKREAIDTALMDYCLDKSMGNVSKAAKMAGVSAKTLRNKISKKPYVPPKVKEPVKIHEKKPKELKPSEESRKRMIRMILSAKEVYQIRGLFNLYRQYFNYDEILNSAYRKLKDFKEDVFCKLSREAAEDLEEDIEIYQENPHLHYRVYMSKNTLDEELEEEEESEEEDIIQLSSYQDDELDEKWLDRTLPFI